MDKEGVWRTNAGMTGSSEHSNSQILKQTDSRPAASGSAYPHADDPGLPQTSAAPSQLARLAHELRTPLSAISAAAELMRDERFGPIGDPRYRGYAGDIYENARHALAVIERMLGATSIANADGPHTSTAAAAQLRSDDQPSSLELVFTEVDVGELVERLTSSLRALCDAAELRLQLEMDDGLPRVVADAVSVRQLLLNLVTNAVRATPPGGTITLSAKRDTKGPVTVAVADTGCGMDTALMQRILSGDARAARTFPDGDGIGMPLVLRFAEANGAQVAIGSGLGRGTRVSITFPLSRLVI